MTHDCYAAEEQYILTVYIHFDHGTPRPRTYLHIQLGPWSFQSSYALVSL